MWITSKMISRDVSRLCFAILMLFRLHPTRIQVAKTLSIACDTEEEIFQRLGLEYKVR